MTLNWWLKRSLWRTRSPIITWGVWNITGHRPPNPRHGIRLNSNSNSTLLLQVLWSDPDGLVGEDLTQDPKDLDLSDLIVISCPKNRGRKKNRSQQTQFPMIWLVHWFDHMKGIERTSGFIFIFTVFFFWKAQRYVIFFKEYSRHESGENPVEPCCFNPGGRHPTQSVRRPGSGVRAQQPAQSGPWNRPVQDPLYVFGWHDFWGSDVVNFWLGIWSTKWFFMILCDIGWSYMFLFDVIWIFTYIYIYILLYYSLVYYIISYYIISYHIILYYIVL